MRGVRTTIVLAAIGVTVASQSAFAQGPAEAPASGSAEASTEAESDSAAAEAPDGSLGATAPSGDAGKYFRAGKAAFEQGDLQTSRDAYLAAWKLSATYDVAANLGQVEVELGLFRDAAEHLTFALANLPPSVSDQTREQVDQLCERARTEVAAVHVTVEPDGAELMVDGTVVGTTPLVHPVFVNQGSHLFEARWPGGVTERVQVTVEKGSDHAVVLGTDAEPGAGTSAESAGAQPRSRGPELGWVPVAVGSTLALIGLGAGVGFTLAADDKRTERNDRLAELGGSSPCGTGTVFVSECERLDRLDEDVTTYSDVAVAGYMLGGIAAAATVTYVLWPRDEGGEQPSAIRVAPAVSARATSVVVWGAF